MACVCVFRVTVGVGQVWGMCYCGGYWEGSDGCLDLSETVAASHVCGGVRFHDSTSGGFVIWQRV